MEVLLFSSSRVAGGGYLEFATEALAEFLSGCQTVHFVPFAVADHELYTAQVGQQLDRFGVRVVGVAADHASIAQRAIEEAQVVFVGGGNSFRLLKQLQEFDLVDVIRQRVRSGNLRYMGSSAGSNMACPTLRTTNDMPIVWPASFAAIGLVPFQINPHYLDASLGEASKQVGETREQRILEFLEENDVPVVGLREGAWLRRRGDRLELGGVAGARLFRRGVAPMEIEAGTDVSWLLETVVRFDQR